MKVIKCDRCGKIVDYEQGLPKFVVTRCSSYTILDMCNECRAALVEFMQMAEQEAAEEGNE